MNAFGGNENQSKLSRLCSKWPQVDAIVEEQLQSVDSASLVFFSLRLLR